MDGTCRRTERDHCEAGGPSAGYAPSLEAMALPGRQASCSMHGASQTRRGLAMAVQMISRLLSMIAGRLVYDRRAAMRRPQNGMMADNALSH